MEAERRLNLLLHRLTTPLTACQQQLLQEDLVCVQWRCSHFARMSNLPDYWQVWQKKDLASHFIQGSVACSGGTWCFAPLIRECLCAHGPTMAEVCYIAGCSTKCLLKFVWLLECLSIPIILPVSAHIIHSLNLGISQIASNLFQSAKNWWREWRRLQKLPGIGKLEESNIMHWVGNLTREEICGRRHCMPRSMEICSQWFIMKEQLPVSNMF